MIVRPATADDAPAMVALQNLIIAIGGTTAYQTPRDAADVRADYIDGPDALTCHVAEEAGRIVGFQSVGRWDGLPEGWADIGTFVAPGLQAQGIGTALFAATRAAARARGLVALNATIRADNAAGQAYYARRGFLAYVDDPDWSLDDGRRVGRISRRFDL